MAKVKKPRKTNLDRHVVWIDGNHYTLNKSSTQEIAEHHKNIGMSSAGCTCTT